MTVFNCRDITFSYSRNSGAKSPCLDGICLTILEGYVFGVIGPNGSGKSTLLKCLYRSIDPQSGEIVFIGNDLESYSTRNLAQKMAVVIQTETASIPLTIREYVRLGRAVYHRVLEGFSTEDELIVDQALEQVGLTDIQNQPITAISGGEYQRTMLARALAQRTDVLLLDEPTNHLDVFHQHQILQIVRRKNISTVVVLHDLNLAARYCDLLAVLDHGKVVAVGTPNEILKADLLENVYNMAVKRLDVDGVLQLVMVPMENEISQRVT